MILKVDGKEYPVRNNEDISTAEKETTIVYTKQGVSETDRMRVYSCIQCVVKHLLSIPEFELDDVNIAVGYSLI